MTRYSTLVRPLALFVALIAAGCTSSAQDGRVAPTLPLNPDPPVSVRPTTIPPPRPTTTSTSTSTSTSTTPSADTEPTTTEAPDPLAASVSCAELFTAATPTLREALTVLDGELGGQTEQQILDLPAARIDEVFEAMTGVAGYDTFSIRRQELGCTGSTTAAGCDDRLDEVAATTLDPMLTDQWLESLGCNASDADGR